MALGALIAAYQEDDEGGLRALLPLAGQSLIEYQVRCAAAAGAAPVIVLLERIPPALNEALERLRSDGLPIIPVSGAQEAATRFEPGALVLLMGDGIVPPPELVAQIVDEDEPVIATVPDTPENDRFERIDGEARWAGLALVEGHVLASTAAMLGDWDLQSTLLRRTLQGGAARLAVGAQAGEPLLADGADQLADFERAMIHASRVARRDAASRYVLAPFEEFATEQLMDTRIKPGVIMWSAVALTVAGALAFLLGWPVIGLMLLLLSTPLDLVAGRIATLRLRPLPSTMVARRLLWPAAGLALVALGWWAMRDQGAGWGALATAGAALAFADAARVEAPAPGYGGELWLFSRRNAIVAAIPFAIGGGWTAYIVTLALYAAASFFLLQHVRHRVMPELTRD